MDMELTEKTLTQQTVYSGKILRVNRDTVLLPNGHESVREVVRHMAGVCILPVDENDDVYLVSQFRYPYAATLLELPAGKLENGEDKLECAMRELKEETGLTAGKFEYMGEIYPSPGYTDEIIHLYLATDLKRSSPSPDEDEFLNVKVVNVFKLTKMISKNQIKDAKTLIALMRYNLK
ncbi:MAG: NUDIX domain-containing protein [Christensenellales bacterium]